MLEDLVGGVGTIWRERQKRLGFECGESSSQWWSIADCRDRKGKIRKPREVVEWSKEMGYINKKISSMKLGGVKIVKCKYFVVLII
jgi:hypothetical protein